MIKNNIIEMVEDGYTSKISYMFNYFLKKFGLVKTIKGIFFYNYRLLLRQFINLKNEKLIEINGHPFFTVPNDKGISEELLMFKTHEPLSTKILSKLLEPGMVCLDVGSNIGYYACLESLIVGNTGKIIAIEPSPINYKYLQKNATLQKIKNIETFNFACGDYDGTIKFAISDRSNWSRVVSNDLLDSPPDSIISEQEIPLVQIDTFLPQQKIEKIDFLRMDVEGYEYHILKGCVKTIKKFRPFFHIEVHLFLLGAEKTLELFTLFREINYEVRFFIPREMDVSLIGNDDDIKKFTLDDLEKMLKNDNLPMNFLLFLVPRELNSI